MRKVGIVIAGLLLVALTSCGYRSVDPAATGAEKIPGAGELYVFCDRFGTLVYYTNFSNEDDYEAFFGNACVPGTNPIQSLSNVPVDPKAQQIPAPQQWTPDGDLGNTQPGTEEEN